MSDGVKAEAHVTTKRYLKAPETPEKVGGVQPGAQEPQEMVGTPEPSSTPAATSEAPVDSKKETAVLPAPEKKPKANCKKCQGRGYEGTFPSRDPVTGQPIIGKAICSCVKVRR